MCGGWAGGWGGKGWGGVECGVKVESHDQDHRPFSKSCFRAFDKQQTR